MAWYNPADRLAGAADVLFGTPDITERSVMPASREEKFLADLIMDMYNNPEATPVSAMNNYLEKYGIADDFYAAFPEYAESRLTPALQKYKDAMDKVNSMQGVNLSFGGNPVRTGGGERAQIMPFRKMQFMSDQAGKEFEADTGIQKALLDYAAGSMDKRYAMAGDRLNSTVDPAANMWQTMLASRYGVTPTVEQGQIGILGPLLEAMASMTAE